MENFDVLDFIEEVDALGGIGLENVAVVPRQGNIYLRDIRNPFQFYSNEEFRQRFRFHKETVLDHIMPLFTMRSNTNSSRGLPLPLDIQVAIALRYYVTGSFQTVCGDLEFVSQPTVSRIIKNVSGQLAAHANNKIKFPEDLTHVANEFEMAQERYPGLRHIIGAIDCTHVKINRPRGIEHSEVYRNRKGVFSINAQAVAGRDMKFYDLVVRWPGSTHDSRIFRNSRLHSRLISGQLNGILVGDSGYRAAHFMLTHFIEPNSRAQARYNYVQTSTRNVVERSFGALKKQFECLRRGIGTKLTTATNIIVACVVLHDIAREAGEPLFEDNNYQEDQISPVIHNAAYSQCRLGV